MHSPLALAILALSPVPEVDPDILFSKEQTLGAVVDTVEIWVEEPGWANPQRVALEVLIRRTISYSPRLKLPARWRARKTISWANHVTCPQALVRLEELSRLEAPAVTVEGFSPERAITVRADGAIYRLGVEGYYPSEPGRIDLTFGADTPVADWIDGTFLAVAPCWQSEPPKQRD
jgi:hypothetical protein